MIYPRLISYNLLNQFKFFKLIQRSVHENGKILEAYFQEISGGDLEKDDYQVNVAEHLQKLNDSIVNYNPNTKNSFLTKFLSFKASSSKVKGLYLYGSVGCGKTMLMDLFFENCDVKPNYKRRTHFHSFMLDVHSRIHENKKKTSNTSSRKALSYNPIPPVAESIKNESWLICLDEFQVTDIGDAMILKHLFTELFNKGIILVATSNRHPDDLYKNGLQRSVFLPFIPLLKENCNILELSSGIDYRQNSMPLNQSIYILKSDDADQKLDHMFKLFASKENDTIRPKTLTIMGRNVSFEKTCGHVADFDFLELCDRPLGAIDYISLSQLFHTMIIRNIPQFSITDKPQARRFITLIDTLYDYKVRVLFSSSVSFKNLFKIETKDNEIDDEQRKLMDDLGIKLGSADSKSSIFSGQEEIFAFDRTISRIAEMQTEQYWNQREFIN